MSPIIEMESPTADSPGCLMGIAGVPGGGVVVVRSFIGTAETPGSPDKMMEGENNEFYMDVPEGHAGGEIRIEAEAADGSATVRYIPINP